MGAFRSLVRKEFLQLARDRRMIPVLLVAPILQLVVLGFAANQDVTSVPLALVDRDRSPASRELLDAFLSSGRFELVADLPEADAAEPLLRNGAAQMALVVGANYGADLAAGRTPEAQLIVDGSDATSATVGLGYAAEVVSRRGLALIARRTAERRTTAALAGRTLPPPAGTVVVAPRVWYNPDLLSRWYYLPSILAMALMMNALILPSMGVVREKEIGTLEQLIVTPIRPATLIVGKLWPFVLICMVNLTLVAAVVVWFFGVPLAGSFWTLLLLTLPFIVALLGLALLVSTMVRNQQQAMLLSMFAVMVPMIYLSGLMFPIENMPPFCRALTYAVPLRYYAAIIRGVFLKGSGLAVLWPEALALCGFALGTGAAAALRFRKNLE